MSDTIDINVYETTEEVTINITPNVIEVNINKITGGGGGTQTLAQTLDLGNITDGENISISNGDAIILDNGSMLKKGTIDAGNGGSKGISQICGVGYEHKWEAGRLYIMNDGGTTIREVSHNFTITPTATDDVTKGFVQNTRWILDNGDVYVCTDPTEDAAVWELQEFEQVNADWDATSGVAEILNKPTIPAAQVNSDWNATSGVEEILNKPTIPDTSNFVPYTGATADVDLGTHKLLAKDLDINHTSGSGDAAKITKGGSGEALKVVKSSGSGNAASITGGVTLLDELHLTTDLADAYIASASTWNAKQNALGYTPFKFVQTSQTAHTGTTAETIVATATINGGTFNASDVMKVLYGLNKPLTTTGATLRLRINTSNTLTGATLIGGFGVTGTASNTIFKRNFMLNSGNLYGANFAATTIVNDEVNVAASYSNTTYNTANTLYFFFTIQLLTSIDSVTPNLFNITN